MRIVCISDTHGLHSKAQIPQGDILLCAGDITRRGMSAEVKVFDEWLSTLPHRHKIVIAGNHDFCFQDDGERARASLTHGTYLQDQSITVEGIKIYGSPWQPVFCRMAFNLTAPELRLRWEAIPDDTDILLTHGPPRNILDRTHSGHQAGCSELLARLARLQVKLHVFGHIHEGHGQIQKGATTHINASLCDVQMGLSQRAFTVDL